MEHIGTRIRRLRRERDLTQEKLANYLNVSFQAVSKWETGAAVPDISMLAPLAKLLNVTADELLGLTPLQEEDLRKKELEAAYHETQKTGDIAKQLEIAKAAVEEYPGNFKYLVWLAGAESDVGYHDRNYEKDAEKLRESAVHHYEMVIEDCQDTTIRNNALHGIVLALSALDRREEAKTYAMQYSDPDDLLRYCLTGEEQKRHIQNRILYKLDRLLFDLSFDSYNPKAVVIGEAVIKAVIDDGNYLWFHDALMGTFISQARCMTYHGRYDEAIDALRKARFHAEEMDRINKLAKDNPLPYTCSAFNLLTYDLNDFVKIGTDTQTEAFYDWLAWDGFDPLRDREDFKELIAPKTLSQE